MRGSSTETTDTKFNDEKKESDKDREIRETFWDALSDTKLLEEIDNE
jgi:hypothetical protein